MRYGWILKGFVAFTGVNLLVTVPLCFVLSTCLPQGFDFSDTAFFVRTDSTNNLLIGSARMTFCNLFHRVLSSESIAKAYRVNGTNTLDIASNGMVVLPMGNGSCRILPCSRPSWGHGHFARM